MEDIQMVVSDLFKCPSIPRNCLKGIPLFAKAKLQKVVVGDDQGNINILDFSQEQTVVENKSQLTQKEVSMIELAPQPTGEKDRVFYSTGSWLIGLTKKLREFLKYDTQLADIIKHLVVEGNFLFTAGDYLLNQYSMTNDQVTPVTFFMCPDKINDMAAHYITGQSKLNIILACQDSCVRVLYNDEIQYEFIVSAPVSCMQVFSPEFKEISSSKRIEQRKCFIYGLEDGNVIVADMTMVKAIVLMTFKVQGSGINLLKPCDFFKSGATDLFVVRNDSLVELYSVEDQEFVLKASKRITETITSVEAGNFRSPTNCEFVLGTFSGRILLLKTNEDYQKRGFDNKRDDKKLIKDQELKLKQLKTDIQKLEQQFQELKVKGIPYHDVLQGDKDPNGMIYANTFKVSSRLTKNSEDGTYCWIIESQYSIEQVTIQSSVKLEILNQEQELIISIAEHEKSTELCVRLKEQHRKTVEVRFRTREGDAGLLSAFIIPDTTPQTAQLITTEIKALSLHSQVREDIKLKKLPLSTLNLKGSFSKNYMNMWINSLVPDVTNASDEDTVSYLFRNVFTETFLQIKYKQGQALIKSDSITTIAICRSFIVEQANLRGIQVDVKWEVNDDGVVQLINRLMQKLQAHQKVEQSFKLLPALKELKTSESDVSYLSKDFQDILANEEQIVKSFAQLPKRLDFLISMVVEVYNSRCLLKGIKANPQKQDLIKQMLNRFNDKDIVQIILQG